MEDTGIDSKLKSELSEFPTPTNAIAQRRIAVINHNHQPPPSTSRPQPPRPSNHHHYHHLYHHHLLYHRQRQRGDNNNNNNNNDDYDDGDGQAGQGMMTVQPLPPFFTTNSHPNTTTGNDA